MTKDINKEIIKYEERIFSHLEKDLGCSGNKIREDIIKYPKRAYQLRKEAEYNLKHN